MESWNASHHLPVIWVELGMAYSHSSGIELVTAIFFMAIFSAQEMSRTDINIQIFFMKFS